MQILTRGKLPSNYRTSFALPFFSVLFSLLFFPKVKSLNFGAKRPIITLKKHKKTRAFY